VVKADWKQWVLSERIKAVSDLQSRTEDVKVFQILGTETRKTREPKLRLCRGTYSNKVAEERINLVDL